MHLHFVWPVTCALLIPIGLHAQRLEPVPATFSAPRFLRAPSNVPELVQRGNHGAVGAIIGGVAFGALGYGLVRLGCDSGPRPAASATYVPCTHGTKVAIVGGAALVGAVLGYFIGASYPR